DFGYGLGGIVNRDISFLINIILVSGYARKLGGKQPRLDLKQIPLRARRIGIKRDLAGDFLKLIGAGSIVNSTARRELRASRRHGILIRQRPTGTFDGDLVRFAAIGLQVVKLTQAGESTIQN